MFQSRRQAEYMRSRAPHFVAVAVRRLGEGSRSLRGVNPVSEDSKRPKLLGGYGTQRDFGGLRPSQSARHVPASKGTPNEREAMEEFPVDFVHGSRHRELGAPRARTGLQGRDVGRAWKGVK